MTAQMVKNCLKSALIPEVNLPKVAKKANLLPLPFLFFQIRFLRFRKYLERPDGTKIASETSHAPFLCRRKSPSIRRVSNRPELKGAPAPGTRVALFNWAAPATNCARPRLPGRLSRTGHVPFITAQIFLKAVTGFFASVRASLMLALAILAHSNSHPISTSLDCWNFQNSRPFNFQMQPP